MQLFNRIHDILQAAPTDAVALGAPGEAPLRYGQLLTLADVTISFLNGRGIGRGDRVALSLPSGACAATAFLAVACGSTAAPLNPAYRREELELYLRDLGAKAVIVESMGSPAANVAQQLGMDVFELVPQSPQAALFTLNADPSARASSPNGGPAKEGDVALILHTSGTTSRPKMVPMTQGNICASACNIRDTLCLDASDVGLAIMPMFHIHGLVAGLLAPLAAGGSVFCPPGFNALRFFAWMKEARPTWYTAVPTMHQAILGRASKNIDAIRGNPLRLIRSSSASMPPTVIEEIESVFGAPLIEAYGMTEACHQMASNPLPPLARKRGSVGLAAGPDVAVRQPDGQICARSASGEIVVRGANVTAGYLDNPSANAEAFVKGWFRTGDLGTIDHEGYVTITGRIKEIINRGGEKIVPREIDELLMEHPAVLQAVAFGIPHPRLGEEVGAVVVLRDGCQATDRELKEFVSSRVADFKVPSRVLIHLELPKGATGKPQRIGLAKVLGLAEPT